MKGGNGGERGAEEILRRAARSTPLMRLSPYVTCSVRLGSRGARVPKDDRAGVGEMNSHLKPKPLQATPIHKKCMPQVLGSTYGATFSKAPRGVHSPQWSPLVDNRVGKTKLEGRRFGGVRRAGVKE